MPIIYFASKCVQLIAKNIDNIRTPKSLAVGVKIFDLSKISLKCFSKFYRILQKLKLHVEFLAICSKFSSQNQEFWFQLARFSECGYWRTIGRRILKQQKVAFNYFPSRLELRHNARSLSAKQASVRGCQIGQAGLETRWIPPWRLSSDRSRFPNRVSWGRD